MSFSLTILGSSSALPTSKRFPTAHLLNVNEQFFLIDCGEGTQIQLRKYGLNFGKINHIFISHLHGDHTFGLVGLLSSFALLGRKHSLHVFAPSNLEQIIESTFRFYNIQLPFKLIYHVLDNKSLEMIYEDDKMFVNCFPLEHRIPTYGFFFKEKPRERNIKKEAIEDYNIPIKDIVKIKKGADYILPNDKVISNKEITLPPYQQRSYGFITDTLFNEGFAEHVENADLLYHEATFLHKDIDKAKNTFHSSALQAAILANRAKAKKLLIGHFSARYKNHQPFIDEARSSFEHSHGVNDGDVFDVELTRESE